ncbi:MAG: hypothetical protein ACOC04_04475, partial [Halothece sp.]
RAKSLSQLKLTRFFNCPNLLSVINLEQDSRLTTAVRAGVLTESSMGNGGHCRSSFSSKQR